MLLVFDLAGNFGYACSGIQNIMCFGTAAAALWNMPTKLKFSKADGSLPQLRL